MSSFISTKVKNRKKKKLTRQESKLEWYKKYRREQYEFCARIRDNLLSDKNVVIAEAKVKSGKKDMAIIFDLMLKTNKGPNSRKIKIYFASALHRIADIAQRQQLRNWLGQNNVYSVNSVQTQKKFIKEIQKSQRNGFQVYILLDELDYGSKKGQLLSKIWRLVQDNPNEIKAVGFSATPHESLTEHIKPPNNISQKHLTYEPSDNYYGAKKYIEDGRYKQAQPFFEEDDEDLVITEQAHEIFNELAVATRNTKTKQHMFILRLCGWVPGRDKDNRATWYNFIKENKKEIEEYVRELPQYKSNQLRFRIKFVSSKKEDRSIEWDEDDHWRDDYDHNTATLIIVNEMAKRSTEWRCHPYITGYHCWRPNAAVNTSIQEEQRIVFYEDAFVKMGVTKDDIDITVYGNLKYAYLSAGLKQISDLSRQGRVKISGNSSVKTSKKQINDFTLYTKDEYIQDFGLDALKKLEKKNPTFAKNIVYTVKANKKRGTLKKKDWVIPDKVLDKFHWIKGKRMTNMRGGIANWLRQVCYEGKVIPPPIKSVDQILKELNEGLNHKNSKRDNICYKRKGDYMICHRFNKSTETVDDFKNNSMYSN